MSERKVVTAFLQDKEGKLLFVRRSEAVSTYRGRWAGISGSIEPGATPRQQAEKEIQEETGLEVELLHEAEPFVLVDPEVGAFRVFPFLFQAKNPEALQLDWEHKEGLFAEEIPPGETVPALGESLRLARGGAPRRLPPVVKNAFEVWRKDRSEGASTLASQIAALAAEVAAHDPALVPADRVLALRGFCRLAREAHPAMAIISRALACVLDAVREKGPEEGREAARAFAQKIREARSEAARQAVAHIGEGCWATLSRSAVVEEALQKRSGPVRVLESRPLGEGLFLARHLKEIGIESRVYPDAAMAFALSGCKAAVFGADTIRPDGSVVNKIGSLPFALSARQQGIPCYVIAESFKLAVEEVTKPPIEAGVAVPDAPPGLGAEVPLFEEVPAALLTGIIDERGLHQGPLPPSAADTSSLEGPYLLWEDL